MKGGVAGGLLPHQYGGCALTAFSVVLLFGFIKINFNRSNFCFSLSVKESFFPPFCSSSYSTVFAVDLFWQSATVQLTFIHQLLFCRNQPSFNSHQNLRRFPTTANLLPIACGSEINNFLNMQMGVGLIPICRLIVRMKSISVQRYGCLGAERWGATFDLDL